MRQWIQWSVDQFASMIDDAPELAGGLGMTAELELRLSPEVRRPEFRHRCMIEPLHRPEQFECAHRLSGLDGGRGPDHRQDYMRCEDGLRKASRQFVREA